MSSKKIADGKGVHYSRIVKAFEDLDSLQPYNTPPDGLFGINVYIQCNGVYIDGNELDVEFDVPFDDNMEADEAEIVIYNLTDDTINKFEKNKEITIETGYGDDTGVIFRGNVESKKTEFDGCDKVTTIYALDGSLSNKVVNLTFAEGTQASTILKRLLTETGLSVGTVALKRDYTYTSSVTVDGNLDENIKTYSDVCGVSTYISKGQICSRNIKDGDNIDFTVNADTGLIGSPSSFEEEITSEDYVDTISGFDVEMLLQHRICTAAIVNLSSRFVKGSFRVREGKHTYSDGEGLTTFKAIGEITTRIEKKEDSKSSSSSTSSGGSSKIDKYVSYAVQIANDNSHGYDQSSRWGPDYDCSSLVITAVQSAGIGVKSAGANATGSMYAAFKKCGFVDVTSKVNRSTGAGMLKGDILLTPGQHTAIFIGSGQLVNASINERGTTTGGKPGDQTGKEIWTRNYYNHPWTYVLRYNG